MVVEYFVYSSPTFPIWIATVHDEGSKEKFICCISLRSREEDFRNLLSKHLKSVPLKQTCTHQGISQCLERYFRGEVETFETLQTKFLWGSDFQQKVWHALKWVPYGQRNSYGWLAKKICSPKAYRAVGSANGANPIPIIFPCHRIINANGCLGGYNGGIDIKSYLLEIEGKNCNQCITDNN